MLRDETASPRRKALGVALAAGVGAAAAGLVALGNPGNMGICGACFLRDIAGALKLFESGPKVMRPEVTGLALGALAVALVSRRFKARSGGFAAGRFVMGIWMAVAALVFLGCPFRMLQRLGGGDLNAWIGLPGFVAGVGAGLWLERRGFSAGKTAPAPAPVGLLGPLCLAGLLGLFLAGALAGPGPDDAAAKPPHAPWLIALGVTLAAGAALSVTGFCAVSAARQVFTGPKAMFFGAAALVAAYAAVALPAGKFSASLAPQPVAHSEWLWNVIALALLGFSGVLAGGCPVRQIVMSGEGNGDAFVCVAGLSIGGALAHNLGLVSAPALADAPGGATAAGQLALGIGWACCIAYGLWVTRALKAQPA
ncbi:MAG: YedE-related selenium metabolism membrane protein [Planctomycetes bacterium]|nr:YedE-related selenium metabolism membrane protein [Planctomycetota bacterium]